MKIINIQLLNIMWKPLIQMKNGGYHHENQTHLFYKFILTCFYSMNIYRTTCSG